MTELVFILDRSGSMAGLEADTIGGFNSMIAKQKKEAGEALVSTVLFDRDSTVIHDRLPLEKAPGGRMCRKRRCSSSPPTAMKTPADATATRRCSG